MALTHIDNRHNSDLTVYLCGDHSDHQQFYYAERNIHLATDYTVINPTKGEQTYSLLERLEMIQHADVLVCLDSSSKREPMIEEAFAYAVGVDVCGYHSFLEPYEIVRDCD